MQINPTVLSGVRISLSPPDTHGVHRLMAGQKTSGLKLSSRNRVADYGLTFYLTEKMWVRIPLDSPDIIFRLRGADWWLSYMTSPETGRFIGRNKKQTCVIPRSFMPPFAFYPMLIVSKRTLTIKYRDGALEPGYHWRFPPTHFFIHPTQKGCGALYLVYHHLVNNWKRIDRYNIYPL